MNVHAVQVNMKELVQELKDHPERIEEVSQNGWTPLISACNYGDVEVAKVLLQYGADIHAKDNVCG